METLTSNYRSRNACNYLLFGSQMPGRTTYNPSINYRYGFQNQETETEITNSPSHSFFKHRISDNRLGRFLSVDPLTLKYPFYSPYAFSGNRVIDAMELEGLEPWELNSTNNMSQVGFQNHISVQLILI